MYIGEEVYGRRKPRLGTINTGLKGMESLRRGLCPVCSGMIQADDDGVLFHTVYFF